jgi:hypothetical protein
VVISSWKVMTLGIGLMAARSTPMIKLDWGIYFVATWSLKGYETVNIIAFASLRSLSYQPPGAAHRSIKTRDFSKKLYFLFNWINLKAERAR